MNNPKAAYCLCFDRLNMTVSYNRRLRLKLFLKFSSPNRLYPNISISQYLTSCAFIILIISSRTTIERIRELLYGTTVAQQLKQGTHPGLGCNQSRGPFLGTFLGKQKGTDIYNIHSNLIKAFSLTLQLYSTLKSNI